MECFQFLPPAGFAIARTVGPDIQILAAQRVSVFAMSLVGIAPLAVLRNGYGLKVERTATVADFATVVNLQTVRHWTNKVFMRENMRAGFLRAPSPIGLELPVSGCLALATLPNPTRRSIVKLNLADLHFLQESDDCGA